MPNWSAWTPDVLPHVLGVPDPMLEQEVRRAAQEFFRRTRAWVEWLPQQATRAGAVEYDFDLPVGATVVRVERATLGGQPFEVQSFRACSSDWMAHGLPSPGLVSADRSTLHVGSAMPAGQALQVQVSLMPSERARGIPDALHHQYGTHIVHGALARLLAIPAQAWTNFDLSAMRIGMFERAIGSVAVDAWRGHTNNTPRARVRWC